MERFLIEHCSPTLASLKTANLFNYKYTDEKELYGYLRNLNRQLSEKCRNIYRQLFTEGRRTVAQLTVAV